MSITALRVCNTCAVAIENNDFSSYDLDVPRVEAFMLAYGLMVHHAIFNPGNYWDCDSCKQTQIDSGYIYHTAD